MELFLFAFFLWLFTRPSKDTHIPSSNWWDDPDYYPDGLSPEAIEEIYGDKKETKQD